MESKDKILNSRLLGYVAERKLNGCSRVKILAYKNDSDCYILLDENTAEDIFQPFGYVFDPSKNREQGFFIEFEVRPSDKQKNQFDDRYIVNSNVNIQNITIPQIIKTSISIGDFISLGNIELDGEIKCSRFYIRSSISKLLYGPFKFDDSSKKICPVLGKEVYGYKIKNKKEFKRDGSYYFIGKEDIDFEKVKIIDCMDNKQLAAWFKTQLQNIAKSEELISAANVLIPAAKDIIFNCKEFSIEEKNLCLTRIERVRSKKMTLEFTDEEIKKLYKSDYSLFAPLKETLRAEIKKELVADLELIRENLQIEIKELESNRDKLTKDSKLIQEDFDKKKTELEHLNDEIKNTKENYDSILEEMKTKVPIAYKNENAEPIVFEADGKHFAELEQDEGYSLGSLLQKNLELSNIPESFKNELNYNSEFFTKKACFIPDCSWAYMFAKAIRNSKLFVIHVEHDWLHYRDFINNGLGQVLSYCYRNTEINHILVLDSLNLTQPECGLKPVLDAISGQSLSMPGFNRPLPDNLKILATLLPYSGQNKIGLPLLIDSFRDWGQISAMTEKLMLSGDFLKIKEHIGYFKPADIAISTAKKPSRKENNGYFDKDISGQ